MRPTRQHRDLAVKGAHAVLREVRSAPEQRQARHLGRAIDALAVAPEADASRVLFLTPKGWASHVHWEAMIAHGLRLRGADVRFATCGGGLGICDRSNTWEAPPPPCRTCANYVLGSLDAHGLPVTKLNEHWTDDDVWPELDDLGLDELAEVTYRGVPVGRLVDIPVKWFLVRADFETDPLATTTYREFLRSARRIVDALETVLADVDPSVVVMCNGLFLFETIAIEMCTQRGIDYVTYERGYIKGTLFYERNGISCLMDMGAYWPEWSRRPLTAEESDTLDTYLDERRHGKRTVDRFWQDATFDVPERTDGVTRVTMLPNLTWDSAVIGQTVAFDGLADWIWSTIDALGNRDDVELTIRIHPAETKLRGMETREPVADVIRQRYPTLPANVRIIPATDSTSTYTLMEDTDVCVVFSSTTGLEAALMGKPVVVVGQTHYRDKGFTIDVADEAEYRAALDRTIADPAAHAADVELARRYAYLLFFRVPVAGYGVDEHIVGLVRLTETDASSFRPGADERLDRICDGILGLRPFGPLPAYASR